MGEFAIVILIKLHIFHIFKFYIRFKWTNRCTWNATRYGYGKWRTAAMATKYDNTYELFIIVTRKLRCKYLSVASCSICSSINLYLEFGQLGLSRNEFLSYALIGSARGWSTRTRYADNAFTSRLVKSMNYYFLFAQTIESALFY